MAQRIAPESRVVYVDNDPLVLVHARILLAGSPEGMTDYIDADVRDPDPVRRYVAALPPGSHLALSDGVNVNPALVGAVSFYNERAAFPYTLRSPEQLAGYFEGARARGARRGLRAAPATAAGDATAAVGSDQRGLWRGTQTVKDTYRSPDTGIDSVIAGGPKIGKADHMDVDGRTTSVRTVGPYTLVRRLGEGGMGVVYLASDPSGRRVALKVMKPDRAFQEEFRRRFDKEAEAARRVARFCTAPVLDSGVDNGLAYLVTEYVEGPDLAAVVEAQGPFVGANLEALAVGVATALVAIHQAEVIHRDLKPSNILLSPLGGPRVIDFGIAQLADTLGTQSLIGTPAYMAPEQPRGERVSPATDVFAWGGVITYAGTGSPPFGLGGAAELMYRIVHDAPRLDGLDDRLRPVVEYALEKDPSRRPSSQQLLDRLLGRERVTVQSATEVVEEIWTPVEGSGTIIAAEALRRRRRRWIPVAAVLAAVAVTAAVLLVVLWPGGPGDRLSQGGALAQRDVPRNGYNLQVRIDSLSRDGKTVTLEWSVKFVSANNAGGRWEPGSAFGKNVGLPTYSTDAVVLIDPATGGRHATASNDAGCLCSDLRGRAWTSGETASFYNAFTDVAPTAEDASVDIPGIGLFRGIPIEAR
ncbi:SAM-dependent methyltransferase [Nonomuraea sp. M3C6]|uniref:SAM-dependent methyltransferase n=1 Tax=Nonomuraea marmarensis TaxID=3351344 RepID=A0ABW7AUN7_9ACTN